MIEEELAQIMQNAQVDRTTAEFIYALQLGKVEGDALNQDGKDPDKDARLELANKN